MVRAIIDEHQAACEADAAVSSPEDESVIVDMLAIDFELNDETTIAALAAALKAR
jgi:hypothetical protein